MLNGTLLRPFDQCQSVKTPRGKSPAWVCLPILPLACLTFYPNNLPHLHIHQAAQLVRITFIPHRTCSFSYLSEFVSTVQSALDFNDNIKNFFLWVFRCLCISRDRLMLWNTPQGLYTSLYYSVFIHFFLKMLLLRWSCASRGRFYSLFKQSSIKGLKCHHSASFIFPTKQHLLYCHFPLHLLQLV